MKKFHLIVILIPVLIIFIRCEKVKTDPYPIQIITDKETYSPFESIKVEIINKSDSVANYFVCSSYKGIPPNIYKKENDGWTGYMSPICNGFSSYCCGGLLKGVSYKDTLSIELETGVYRLEYQFIIHPDHEYKSFFSDLIKVE